MTLWLKTNIYQYLSLSHKSLYLFRICFGLCILFSLGSYYYNFDWALSAEGTLPVSMAIEDRNGFVSFYWYLPDYISKLCILFTMCLSLLFILGIGGVCVKILLTVLMISLSARNVYLGNGWDSVMRGLLCWSVFLPLNKTKGEHTSLATLGVVVFISLIYLYAFIAKYGSGWTTDLDAVWKSLWHVSTQTRAGMIIREFIPYEVFQAITYAVVYLEGLIGICLLSIWKSQVCRLLAALGILILHGNISFLLYLGLFGPGMCCVALLLIPDFVWQRLRLS